jgi:hypothetical protein
MVCIAVEKIGVFSSYSMTFPTGLNRIEITTPGSELAFEPPSLKGRITGNNNGGIKLAT